MLLTMTVVNTQAAKRLIKSEAAEKTFRSVTLVVGQTKTVKATGRGIQYRDKKTMYRPFSMLKKNDGMNVESSDDFVVAVEKLGENSYSYTAKNPGKARLIVTARAENGKILKLFVNIKVVKPFKVTQTGASAFTISFAEKYSVEKEYLSVLQKNTEDSSWQRLPVKEVKMSQNRRAAEVRMEQPFVNGAEYNVGYEDEIDEDFTAFWGVPKVIDIKTGTVFANKPKAIDYAILDERGMEITEIPDVKNRLNVEVSAEAGDYDESSNLLTLRNPGDTAKVKITYRGQPGGNASEATGTIVCIDKPVVTVEGIDKWTIANSIYSWTTDSMRKMLPQGKTSKLWIRMKKSDGTYIDNKKHKSAFTFTPNEEFTFIIVVTVQAG